MVVPDGPCRRCGKHAPRPRLFPYGAGVHNARVKDAFASRLQLPPGPWATVLDALCDRFPAVGRARWIDRMQRGLVRDAAGAALAVDAPHRVGLEIRYQREVADEVPVPFEETLLHVDAHLVVADKPHFLPVTPSGDYLEHTLSASGDALAAAYTELVVDGKVLWGVGIDGDIAIASIKALISAVNRAVRS